MVKLIDILLLQMTFLYLCCRLGLKRKWSFLHFLDVQPPTLPYIFVYVLASSKFYVHKSY